MLFALPDMNSVDRLANLNHYTDSGFDLGKIMEKVEPLPKVLDTAI